MGDPLLKVVYFFQAVEIVGMEMATDFPSTFEEQSCIKMVGYDLVNIFTTECARDHGLYINIKL